MDITIWSIPKMSFLKLIFIAVELFTMLCQFLLYSRVSYTYINTFLDSLPIQVTTQHQVEFLMLNSQNFFGITVLQFVGHLLSSSLVGLIATCMVTPRSAVPPRSLVPPITRPSRINTQKNVLFIRGDWNAKVGSQEIHGITGTFGLVVQHGGQKLTELCQENTLVIANTLS